MNSDLEMDARAYIAGGGLRRYLGVTAEPFDPHIRRYDQLAANASDVQALLVTSAFSILPHIFPVLVIFHIQ